MSSDQKLAAIMRLAADTLALANERYGFNADYGVWNPRQLRHEADVLDEVPNG